MLATTIESFLCALLKMSIIFVHKVEINKIYKITLLPDIKYVFSVVSCIFYLKPRFFKCSVGIRSKIQLVCISHEP